MQVLFSEPLAIYVLMFYLGSLVRYYPYYLEQLLESKYARIIECFLAGAPETFLRHMTNLILDHNYVLVNR